jgi:Fe-Mn family superoxide dismutase
MAFTLPDLPYSHDALAPFMSKETLEFHHDKHHLAYVNNGSNALKGTEWEGKPLEEIVKGSHGKNPAVFNNAGQHYNHIHFWKWMKKDGGGDKIPAKLKAAIEKDLGGVAKAKEDFIRPASRSSAPAGPGSPSRTASSSSTRRRTAKARW